MNSEKLREELRQAIHAAPTHPLAGLLNRCYVALGEQQVPDGWPTDAMVKALYDFISKSGYLSHPEVKWHGTINGDTEEAWTLRVMRAGLVNALAAAPSAPAAQGDGREKLRERVAELESWQETVRNSSELLRQRDAALDELAALKAQDKVLVEDAARYRWILENCCRVVTNDLDPIDACSNAIDAERSANKP